MATGRRSRAAAGLLLGCLMGIVVACGGDAAPGTPVGTPVPVVGGQVTITAKDIAFQPATITTPSTALTITFDNQDAGVPHDLVLKAGDVKLAATEIITGPATTTLAIQPLQPGAYQFTCSVHPNMTGTLTVEGG
jgi:plastocyanin